MDDKRSNSSPWMQFWGGDFMKSTAQWTATERGAYLILLWHSWENDGLMPDPSRIFRLDPDIEPSWGLLSEKFPVASDGKRRNPRQEQIRARMIEISRLNSAAGKASAAARQHGFNARSNSRSNECSDSVAKKGNGTPNGNPTLSPLTSHLSESHISPSTSQAADGGGGVDHAEPADPEPTGAVEREIIAIEGQAKWDGQKRIFAKKLGALGLANGDIGSAWSVAVNKWHRHKVSPCDSIADLEKNMPKETHDKRALILYRIKAMGETG